MNMNIVATSKSITIQDFPQICRLCLSEDGTIVPIYDLIVGDVKATDLIQYSVGIEPCSDDEMPGNVCENCLKELYRIYEFKRHVYENDEILKLLLSQSFKCHTKVEIIEEKNVELEIQVDKCNKSDSLENTTANIEDVAINTDLEDSAVGTVLEDPPVDTDPEDSTVHTDLEATSPPPVTEVEEKPPLLKCKSCPAEFNSTVILKQHTIKSHSSKKTKECKVCGRQLRSSKMTDHMRTHTQEKPYKCEICFVRFSLNGNLKRHMMTHTGERPHICSVCGKGFIQATSLINHERSHKSRDESGTELQQFHCFCGRYFRRAIAFNRHLEKHREMQDTKVKQEPLENLKREHVCEICGKSYTTRTLLKTHQKSHGEKTFFCEECGKGFYLKSSMKAHMRIHTGEKPYKCPLCPKIFAHSGSLDTHSLTHTGIRPHKCTHCGKTFTQNTHLVYHLRTHSGERPYSCKYCGRAFALKGNLTVHIRTHTGETPYVCSICSRGFYDSSSMKKHRKKHFRHVEIDQQIVDVVEQDVEFSAATDHTYQVTDNYIWNENIDEDYDDDDDDGNDDDVDDVNKDVDNEDSTL